MFEEGYEDYWFGLEAKYPDNNDYMDGYMEAADEDQDNA